MITALGVGAAAVEPGAAAAAPVRLPKPQLPASIGRLPTTGRATSPVAVGKLPSSISAVKQRLDGLARHNDQLVEKYDQAQVAYARSNRAADRAEAASQAAQRYLERSRAMLGYSVTAQYEGGEFSATGALLSSPSGSSYLDQLDTMSMVSAHNAQVVADFTAARRQAADAAQRAEGLVADAQKTRDALAKQRRATAAQIAKYKKVLANLTAEQRALIASRSHVSVSRVQRAVQEAQSPVTTTGGAIDPATGGFVTAVSPAAQTAVQFALAQVGKPYVWGAAGPGSYDCSGLTMSAWAAAGVSLPHSAYQQYSYGTHVSLSQLEPGDLIFMYTPISHVTIYIGRGLMVSAPQTGEDVQVVPVSEFGSDIVGATRPGT